jgi:YVTN family beta-propeller protein
MFGYGPDGIAITPDGSRVYVANTPVGTISVIDTAMDAIIRTITIPNGAGPVGLAVTPDGTTLYPSSTAKARRIGKTWQILSGMVI